LISFLFLADQKELANIAWKFLSDLYFTTICLQYEPQQIAAATLYLASTIENIPLDSFVDQLPWFHFLSPTLEFQTIQGKYSFIFDN